MPKRRLHGITQKRRQKAKSAALKRSQSPHRVVATQAPAPFERASEIGRQDVEFLEVMRELQVQPNPRRPINPERLKSVEKVQILADAEGETEFLHVMERLGVRPLRKGTSAPEPAPRPRRVRSEPAGSASAAAPGAEAKRPIPSGSMLVREADIAPRGPTVIPGARKSGKPQARRTAVPEPVQFVEEPVDMAALLAKHLDPALKYEGAPKPKPVQAEPRRDDADPDDELDLHGKTVEEAIRMVQNFLLVAHQKRFRSVVIVTGRGLNSGKDGPVLRGAVQTWLERNGAPYCKEFGQAPGKLGGAGALLIRMR